MLNVNKFCDLLVSNYRVRVENERRIEWLYLSYCSKEKIMDKWDWGNEVKKYKVIDIYKGRRFDLFRDVVRMERVKLENVYVFSGKWGVIRGDVEIEYYDKYFRVEEMEEMKVKVREWVRVELEKRGKFGVKYYVDDDIWKKSSHYVKVIVDVLKEMEIEYKIIDLIYG